MTAEVDRHRCDALTSQGRSDAVPHARIRGQAVNQEDGWQGRVNRRRRALDRAQHHVVRDRNGDDSAVDDREAVAASEFVVSGHSP